MVASVWCWYCGGFRSLRVWMREGGCCDEVVGKGKRKRWWRGLSIKAIIVGNAGRWIGAF
jgi:hypothetical protein